MGNRALLLTKVNLQNTFNLAALTKASAKEKLKIGLIALAVLSVAVTFISMIAVMFYVTGQQLEIMGMTHLLPAICILAVTALIFMMTLYKANSYLFSFRDFDALMSLPVTEREVLLSKVIVLYFSNLLYAFFGYIPMMIAYGVTFGAGITYYLVAMAFFFLVPVLPMVAGALLALPLAMFSSRSRMSNLFMLIGSIALVGVSLWASFASASFTSGEAVMEAVLSAKDIVGFYAPALWLAEGLGGDILAGMLFAVVNLLAAILFVYVYGKAFRAINAKMTERFSRAAYKMQTLAVSGICGALYKRELKGYFSSYIYVLNTAMGVIMATAYIVLLVFMDYETVAQMLEIPAATEMMVPVTLIVMGACAILSTTTACSVSIEGRSLWILKSLPIRFWDVAKAKVALSLTVSVPLLLLDTAVLAVVFGFDFIEFGAVALVVLLCCLMSAVGGLVINLKFPNLEWKSQVQAVKQSMSVIIALLAHAAILVIPCIAYVVLGMPNLTAFLFGTAAYLAVICCAFAAFLQNKGEKIFLNL